jgi:hypothetical protein
MAPSASKKKATIQNSAKAKKLAHKITQAKHTTKTHHTVISSTAATVEDSEDDEPMTRGGSIPADGDSIMEEVEMDVSGDEEAEDDESELSS